MECKRLLLLAVFLPGMAFAQYPGNAHIEKTFTTDWDSTWISSAGVTATIDVDNYILASTDTLYVARNNDTTAAKRWKVYPGSTRTIDNIHGVRYVKVRAASSCAAIVDVRAVTQPNNK